MVTKKKSKKMKQKSYTPPEGTDYATVQDFHLYVQYVFTRKALIHDVKARNLPAFVLLLHIKLTEIVCTFR